MYLTCSKSENCTFTHKLGRYLNHKRLSGTHIWYKKLETELVRQFAKDYIITNGNTWENVKWKHMHTGDEHVHQSPRKKTFLIQHTDERGAVDLRYVYIDLTPSGLI